jgi:large subunit ribosomal protein L20
MARVKRGVTAHAKHKKVLKQAEGFYGARSRTIRTAKAAVDKSLQYQYRDRRNKKREFRGLWVQRINAAAREHGLTYSRLMDGLNKAGIEIDRKMLSDIAIHEPAAFEALVGQAKKALQYLKETTPNAFESAVG